VKLGLVLTAATDRLYDPRPALRAIEHRVGRALGRERVRIEKDVVACIVAVLPRPPYA
jgi:hypothetical protein